MSWDAQLTAVMLWVLWVLLIDISALAVSADDRRAVVLYGPALLAGTLGSLVIAT